ncbi:MAG: hypothetical protein HQM11_00055 [SAR324 cluster bacterium]|nr:hypothetical protein [SAR324 cluster bacterium]
MMSKIIFGICWVLGLFLLTGCEEIPNKDSSRRGHVVLQLKLESRNPQMSRLTRELSTKTNTIVVQVIDPTLLTGNEIPPVSQFTGQAIAQTLLDLQTHTMDVNLPFDQSMRLLVYVFEQQVSISGVATLAEVPIQRGISEIFTIDSDTNELTLSISLETVLPAAGSFGTPPNLVLSGGGRHSCRIDASNAIQCWGRGDQGELGNGFTTNSMIPVSVYQITTARHITTGVGFSCAVLTDGTVSCWGNNTEGTLGNGETDNQSYPVAARGVTNAIQVSTGSLYVCAVLETGKGMCWGNLSYGSIITADDFTPGTGNPTPKEINGLSNVVQIAPGGVHACALISNGTVQCWGYGGLGQLGQGSTSSSETPVRVLEISDVKQITSGGVHSCALLKSGLVKCWGGGTYGQLGHGQTPEKQANPVDVSGITNATQITAGFYFTCALLQTGTVQCWGNGKSGQLGNETNTAIQSTPVDVSTLGDVLQISAGNSHVCAVLNDLSMKCWGLGQNGQLGNGQNSSHNKPVAVQITGETLTPL